MHYSPLSWLGGLIVASTFVKYYPKVAKDSASMGIHDSSSQPYLISLGFDEKLGSYNTTDGNEISRRLSRQLALFDYHNTPTKSNPAFFEFFDDIGGTELIDG